MQVSHKYTGRRLVASSCASRLDISSMLSLRGIHSRKMKLFGCTVTLLFLDPVLIPGIWHLVRARRSTFVSYDLLRCGHSIKSDGKFICNFLAVRYSDEQAVLSTLRSLFRLTLDSVAHTSCTEGIEFFAEIKGCRLTYSLPSLP